MTDKETPVNPDSSPSDDSLKTGAKELAEDSLDDQPSEARTGRRSRPQPRLEWLVDDFSGITTSVYEAAIISSLRARQIGRRQKMEIDTWNAENETPESDVVPEEEPDEGTDHFNHPKPTVQALTELRSMKINYRYPDDKES